MATQNFSQQAYPATADHRVALWAMADVKSEWGMDDPDLEQGDEDEMLDLGAMGPY